MKDINNQTRIVICGSPHTGKTVFSKSLYKILPQKYTFLIEACPDGEGVFSNNEDQDIVQLIRRKGEMSSRFVNEKKQQIINEDAPIVLVDVGGMQSKENEEIFKECDLAIVLGKSEEDIESWKEFCLKQNVEILAEIKSELAEEGKSFLSESTDIIKGNVVNLERGKYKIEDDVIMGVAKRISEIASEKGLLQKGKELLTEDNVQNGNYYDMIVATTELDENGISRVIDNIPVPVYLEKGGNWDRVQEISYMDLDSYDYVKGDYAADLNNGVYEWDIESALIADNLEKAEELIDNPEYTVYDVDYIDYFYNFLEEYIELYGGELLDESKLSVEYNTKLKNIIDKLKNYTLRTEDGIEHNIAESYKKILKDLEKEKQEDMLMPERVVELLNRPSLLSSIISEDDATKLRDIIDKVNKNSLDKAKEQLEELTQQGIGEISICNSYEVEKRFRYSSERVLGALSTDANSPYVIGGELSDNYGLTDLQIKVPYFVISEQLNIKEKIAEMTQEQVKEFNNKAEPVEVKEHSYRYGRVDGYYTKYVSDFEINGEKYHIKTGDWTNGGTYTVIWKGEEENYPEVAMGLSSSKSEWASSQRGVNKDFIIKFISENPMRFSEYYDSLVEDSDCCGTFPAPHIEQMCKKIMEMPPESEMLKERVEKSKSESSATIEANVEDSVLEKSSIEKHNIEEIEGAISDRKLSDVNKVTEETVQANEEKEQKETSKTVHKEQ